MQYRYVCALYAFGSKSSDRSDCLIQIYVLFCHQSLPKKQCKLYAIIDICITQNTLTLANVYFSSARGEYYSLNLFSLKCYFVTLLFSSHSHVTFHVNCLSVTKFNYFAFPSNIFFAKTCTYGKWKVDSPFFKWLTANGPLTPLT